MFIALIEVLRRNIFFKKVYVKIMNFFKTLVIAFTYLVSVVSSYTI
jgi:hypothetical protein